MRVAADYICGHDMPRPWATCFECMSEPPAQRPEPPPEQVVRVEAAPKRPGGPRLPEAANDPIPPLRGTKDLSVPVHDFMRHVTGPNNDWLFAGGGLPHDLRSGGWVYLRNDGRLGWRARVRGIGFREVRVNHTGEPPSDQGPGATIELIASTWEQVDHDLGELADSQIQGYRYLITTTDDELIHLPARAPIPDGITVDPPYAEGA